MLESPIIRAFFYCIFIKYAKYKKGDDILAFQGLSIIFDDIPSEEYGLYLASYGNNSSQGSKDMGIDLDIKKEKLGLRNTPYLQSVEDKGSLSFPMTLSSLKPMDSYDIDTIQKWLFGHNKYKKLQIVQDDLRGVYFNCILNKPKTIEMENNLYGFEFTVECDTSNAWQYEKSMAWNITKSNQNIFFTNESSLNDYMYPTIEFSCGKAGGKGSISIINKSDNNREFKMTDMFYGEKLIFDSNTEIATTSLTSRITPRFNKKFIRLVPGINQLTINGDINNIKVKYQNARRVSV